MPFDAFETPPRVIEKTCRARARTWSAERRIESRCIAERIIAGGIIAEEIIAERIIAEITSPGRSPYRTRPGGRSGVGRRADRRGRAASA